MFVEDVRTSTRFEGVGAKSEDVGGETRLEEVGFIRRYGSKSRLN